MSAKLILRIINNRELINIMENMFDTHSHYADSAFHSDRDQLLEAVPSRGV